MLGMLLAGAWFLDGTSFSLFSQLPQNISANESQQSSESGAVSVANQPAGSAVAIESVTVPPPGVWIAVREMNGDMLGNVLGAARATGPRSQFTVSLLRATEPGLTYAVELYRDDGDNVFDLSSDSVYIDFMTSRPAIAHFTTTD